jgi:hypothetical protein
MASSDLGSQLECPSLCRIRGFTANTDSLPTADIWRWAEHKQIPIAGTYQRLLEAIASAVVAEIRQRMPGQFAKDCHYFPFSACAAIRICAAALLSSSRVIAISAPLIAARRRSRSARTLLYSATRLRTWSSAKVPRGTPAAIEQLVNRFERTVRDSEQFYLLFHDELDSDLPRFRGAVPQSSDPGRQFFADGCLGVSRRVFRLFDSTRVLVSMSR